MAKSDRAIIYRVEHFKGVGGTFYSAHWTEENAIEGIQRRVQGGMYIKHVLQRCERDAVTFEDERVLETRHFDAKGREMVKA